MLVDVQDVNPNLAVSAHRAGLLAGAPDESTERIGGARRGAYETASCLLAC
jgi:hypothetical protein